MLYEVSSFADYEKDMIKTNNIIIKKVAKIIC